MSCPLFAGTLGPSRYRESRPSAHVSGVVACRWVGEGGWDRSLRLMPDGCADLVWDGAALFVVGARPGAARFPVGADTRNVGLRLRPGTVAAVTGYPADELVAEAVAARGRTDTPPAGTRPSDLTGALAPPDAPPPYGAGTNLGPSELAGTLAPPDALPPCGAGTNLGPSDLAATLVPPDALPPCGAGTDLGPSDGGAAGGGCVALDLLWGPAARRLVEALAAASGPAAQLRLLEDAVAHRLAAGPGPDRSVVQAASLLGRPGATVSDAGRAVGLSARELRRRFLDHVGYGPKVLHRVLRFQRFLGQAPAVASGARPLAGAAAEAGYADQSHLGRECRRLTGSSPAALLHRWAAAHGGPGRNVPDAPGAAPAGSSPCATTRSTHRPSGSGWPSVRPTST